MNVLWAAPALGFIKLSIFLIFYQMFWPMRWMRIAVYIGSAITIGFYGAVTICMLVFSIPRPGQTWFTHTITPLYGKAQNLALPITAVGLVLDIYLLVLPIGAVIKLRLPPARKIGVTIAFATGLW